MSGLVPLRCYIKLLYGEKVKNSSSCVEMLLVGVQTKQSNPVSSDDF